MISYHVTGVNKENIRLAITPQYLLKSPHITSLDFSTCWQMNPRHSSHIKIRELGFYHEQVTKENKNNQQSVKECFEKTN